MIFGYPTNDMVKTEKVKGLSHNHKGDRVASVSTEYRVGLLSLHLYQVPTVYLVCQVFNTSMFNIYQNMFEI